MLLPIRCSRYILLFNLIFAAQLVKGNPQRGRGGPIMQDSQGEQIMQNGQGEQIMQDSQREQMMQDSQGVQVIQNGQGWIAAGPPETFPGDYSQPNELSPSHPAPVGNLSIRPSPTYGPNCDVCTISVSSISLYYWPQESTKTECLATIPPQPSPTYPPGLNPIYPSVYALFFSVTVNDACGFTVSYSVSTASFNPDAVSTVDLHGTVQPFNLADLPCPPPSVKLQPGEPFKPWFAWNTELFFKQNSEPPGCKTMTGLNAWPDPPRALPTVKGGLPAPTQGPLPRDRLRMEAVNAHVAPRVPARTTAAP